MLKALLKKEWTQLRALRWVGLGLGLLLPPFVLASAEAASRGWLPFGRVSGYAVGDLFRSALPGFLVGLWCALSLLLTAQAFAGDRSAGTERFLLERPVPRSRIWWARLLAALASLALLAVAHSILWLLLATAVAAPARDSWTGGVLILAAGGALAVPLSFAAGVAAASLVTSPIQAILLGLVLAAVPPGLSGFLGDLSPMARIALVPLGSVLPGLLLPGYLAASYATCCLGEPAGRGRLRRGFGVLGICCLAMIVLFLAGVPWALRAAAADLTWPELIAAEGGGRAICVIDSSRPPSAGWLVDAVRARKLRFLPPPVEAAAWNREGSRLAVAHRAGPLGGYAGQVLIDFFDEQGERAGRRIRLPGGEIGWVRELRWAGDELIAAAQATDQSGAVLIVAPETGAVRRVPIREHALRWNLVGPTAAGEMLVQLVVDAGAGRHVLRRLDLARAELDPEPLLDVEGLPTWANWEISPSGGYWMARVGKRREGFRVVGLRGGEDLPLPECLWAHWLTGERFACLEAAGDGWRLTVGSPGAARREIGAWSRSSVTAEVSPGGSRVLLHVWDPAGETEASASSEGRVFWTQGHGWIVGRALREVLVYDEPTGALTDLTSRWGPSGPTASRPARWAGRETLAFVGQGDLSLADLEGEGAPRRVFGRP